MQITRCFQVQGISVSIAVETTALKVVETKSMKLRDLPRI